MINQNIDKKIIERLASDDTIYHYCSTSTALEYILFDLKLKLSHRKKSTDPIESSQLLVVDSETFKGNDNDDKEVAIIIKYISEIFKHVKQACFCQNNFDFGSDCLEFYGFLKPRMWDQYADKYNGVCIAFSKSKILSKNKAVLSGKVEYVKYSDLSDNDFYIDCEEINRLGILACQKEINKKIKSVLLRKHLDYFHENEYRLISTMNSKELYFDISDCITAIIVPSERTNKFKLMQIKKYIQDLNIVGLSIFWRDNGIIINPLI